MGNRHSPEFTKEQWDDLEALGLFKNWKPQLVAMAKAVLVDGESQVDAAHKHDSVKQQAYRSKRQAIDRTRQVATWSIQLPRPQLEALAKSGTGVSGDSPGEWMIETDAVTVIDLVNRVYTKKMAREILPLFSRTRPHSG